MCQCAVVMAPVAVDASHSHTGDKSNIVVTEMDDSHRYGRRPLRWTNAIIWNIIFDTTTLYINITQSLFCTTSSPEIFIIRYFAIILYKRIAFCGYRGGGTYRANTRARRFPSSHSRRDLRPHGAQRTSEHSTGTPNSRIARVTTDRHDVCAAEVYYFVVLFVFVFVLV